ncbi:hypothetical protein K439DRAFT_1620106 [Ramaria rubella]|nr:hypothetical protein K439DRAFT_1620106 [Ramaria rubella]
MGIEKELHLHIHHNIALAEQFWAGMDDDEGSDYDELEIPEDAEDEPTEDELTDDNEDDEVAPRPFKSKPKATFTVPPTAAVPVLSNNTVYPQNIIFIVPCHDQYGQYLMQKVPVPFIATTDVVILIIQAVIGSLKLPATKRPPLIVKLNKNRTPRLALNTTQDCEQLKADWLTDYNKKKVPIEVSAIVPKKMLKDIEEAVKASISKTKKPAKKAVNPYLSAGSDDEDGGADDAKDFKMENSDEYNKKWGSSSCSGLASNTFGWCVWVNSHGYLCWCMHLFYERLQTNVIFQINGTAGIDLDNPPHVDSFKDWYFKPSTITHQVGARMIGDTPPPTSGTHVTIHMPPEAFQHNPQPAPDMYHRHSPFSGSSRSISPVLSDTPDVGAWLNGLQISTNFPSINWTRLTTKFKNEDYLAMPLPSLAAFSSDLMQTDFGLNIQELLVVTEQLQKAAKQHGFILKGDAGKSRGN